MVIDFIVYFASVWVIYFLVTCIHEMGHYLFAIKYGVYCTEFRIGIRGTGYQRQCGETIFRLSFPFVGGRVFMAQDTDPVPAPYHRTLQAKKPYQRILIHTAGPLFNLMSGVLSFFYLYFSTESIPSALTLYPESSIISVHFFMGIFFYISLLMCFFNLIPFKKFDGRVFISEIEALKKVGS